MGHTITSLGKISKFSKFYVQNIWQVVRWWHQQLTHLHIHIDWSRNVLWKFAKLQNVITSLFFDRFSSGFHYYVWKFLLVFLKFKLNLFRISPLKVVIHHTQSVKLYLTVTLMLTHCSSDNTSEHRVLPSVELLSSVTKVLMLQSVSVTKCKLSIIKCLVVLPSAWWCYIV